jgi:hypothetical protein
VATTPNHRQAAVDALEGDSTSAKLFETRRGVKFPAIASSTLRATNQMAVGCRKDRQFVGSTVFAGDAAGVGSTDRNSPDEDLSLQGRDDRGIGDRSGLGIGEDAKVSPRTGEDRRSWRPLRSSATERPTQVIEHAQWHLTRYQRAFSWRAAASAVSSGCVLNAIAASGAALWTAFTTISNSGRLFGGSLRPPAITTQS